MEGGKTIDALVGAKVRAHRILTHVSQDELATTVGIDVGDLAGYEAGLTRFPPDLLLRIAEVLGAKVSDLFQGADEMMVAGTAAVAATLSGRLDEMQDLFTRLSPSLQDEVLAFSRVLANRSGPVGGEP